MNRNLAENITNEDIQDLPLRSFDGNIHVIETDEECRKALAILGKESMLGFDTETKPTFKKGEYNHTALVQLSTLEDAYLFRLNKLGTPADLYDIFENEEILKLGISITDDLKDLKRLRKYKPSAFLDINDVAKDLDVKHMGVKKLAAVFLEYRISKNQQTSNWENEELTEAQQRYAATDAWICLAIYDKLIRQGYV